MERALCRRKGGLLFHWLVRGDDTVGVSAAFTGLGGEVFWCGWLLFFFFEGGGGCFCFGILLKMHIHAHFVSLFICVLAHTQH